VKAKTLRARRVHEGKHESVSKHESMSEHESGKASTSLGRRTRVREGEHESGKASTST
jgi:hypothetical protein